MGMKRRRSKPSAYRHSRGVCAGCGKTYALRNDGTVWWHVLKGIQGSGKICPGANANPA